MDKKQKMLDTFKGFNDGINHRVWLIDVGLMETYDILWIIEYGCNEKRPRI